MSSIYSNPVTELITRLTYHTADVEGRLLQGWKFHDKPLENPDGQTDFPSVQLFLPDVSETFMGRVGTGTLTVLLAVSTLRSEGVPAWLDAIAKVMDAIETDTAGNINPGLRGTLTSPVDLSVGNSFSTGLSLTAQLNVLMRPKPFERGQR
jgi:hypothetical protein